MSEHTTNSAGALVNRLRDHASDSIVGNTLSTEEARAIADLIEALGSARWLPDIGGEGHLVLSAEQAEKLIAAEERLK